MNSKSHSVVITFVVPEHIINSKLSNDFYDIEKTYTNEVLEEIKKNLHIPSLIMQGELGISLRKFGIRIGNIKLVENDE